MRIKSVPNHVGIIPDGNRRWAKSKGLSISEGHRVGISLRRISNLFEEANRLGIEYITLWLFSTENWNRKKEEVDDLFKIFDDFVDDFLNYAIKNKIRFRHIGRKDRLPKKIIDKLTYCEKKTENFDNLNVQLCMDYGGMDETLRVVNKIIKSGKKDISEEDFKNFLDTKDIPEIDLIIRTSGEKRTSGFMPHKSAYAELYFTKIKFPDFEAEELRKAVIEYSNRERRFGK